MDNLAAIKNLLKRDPQGLNIREISEILQLNRNSVAKLLDILTAKEEVETRIHGRSKVYYLAKRQDYKKYFELFSRTVNELNSFPPDGDIYAFIAGTLRLITPEDTIILVNSFNQDTRIICLNAFEGLGQRQSTIEGILQGPLTGLKFQVPDRIIPEMVAGECNEIPGKLGELTFGWLPYETCKIIESLPFFGKVYSAGISWKGRLRGAATFILPPGKELENKDMISFFMQQVAGFLIRREAEEALRVQIANLQEKERELRESEELFRLSIDKAPEAIFLFDVHENRYVETNARAEQLFGRSRRQLLDFGPQQFYKPEQPDQRPACETIEEHRRRVLAGEKIIFERNIRNDRGEDLVIEVRLVQLQSAGRTLIRSSFIDITERKRAEEALQLASRKLNLLSGITRHDINNQLMALNTYIELSKGAIDNPVELSDFFAKELNITGILAEQIRFAKDYESIGVKAPAWQNVNTVIRKAMARLPMRDIRATTDGPGIEVLADPLLEKVFYNLIDNALRYGGEKMTTIHVTAREGKGNAVIVVEDDGNGVSVEDKPYLFTKGFGRHTGLGLYLSSEILRITGITITENGEPGKGARFEIKVPEGQYRYCEE